MEMVAYLRRVPYPWERKGPESCTAFPPATPVPPGLCPSSQVAPTPERREQRADGTFKRFEGVSEAEYHRQAHFVGR